MINLKVFIFFLYLQVVCSSRLQKWQTVYQRLGQERELSDIYSLIQTSRLAKINLFYREITLFAPTNEALDQYNGNIDNETLLYHFIYYAKTLEELKYGKVNTILEEYPPLWITKRNDKIYVNNALILKEKSNFFSKNRLDDTAKKQALHMIDEVLESKIFGKRTDAFYLLDSWNLWSSKRYTLSKFHKKVLQNNIKLLYEEEGPHTFFFPVDNLTDVKFNMIDLCVLQAHIIKNAVLFTKPTPKNFPFETTANGENAYVIVTFFEEDSKTFVKSTTLSGDSNHPLGEVIVEILEANVPVSNGVVHLISQPLMVIERPLKKFPYLPIYDKLSTDPNLNITYTIGEKLGFNGELKSGPQRFTFFAPSDAAWKKIQDQMYLGDLFSTAFEREASEILGRHLILANRTYNIEFLKEASKNDTELNLSSLSGSLTMRVKESDAYYIKWKNKLITVNRPDYECTNGIVHVIDDLFLDQEDLVKLGLAKKNNEVIFFLWNALKPLTVKY